MVYPFVSRCGRSIRRLVGLALSVGAIALIAGDKRQLPSMVRTSGELTELSGFRVSHVDPFVADTRDLITPSTGCQAT